MMLAVLLVGYVFVMGPDCYDPCDGKQDNDLCAPEKDGPLTGYCSARQCVPGSPEDVVNRCAGLNEGDVCRVSGELNGTCVFLVEALRCLVIVEIPPAPPAPIVQPDPVVLNPCEGKANDTVCTDGEGKTGLCQGGNCEVSED